MSQNYFKFDTYLICKMLNREGKKDETVLFTDEERHEAYLICLKRIGARHVAATRTIQKWFGIRGRSCPNRETLFQLAFALGFSDWETRELLIQGAREPDFQINDFREIIFLYGFHHSLDYETCLNMIEEFENSIPSTMILSQSGQTNDLRDNYERNCDLSSSEFLRWMMERAEDFKGYSKTILDYFMDLKNEILLEVKRDAEMQLNELLCQNGFRHWNEIQNYSYRRKRRRIRSFLENKGKEKSSCISEDLSKVIWELFQMTAISPYSNAELLAELYADLQKKVKFKKRKKGEVYLMSDKYLSDLLHINIQKEKLLQLVLQGREGLSTDRELSDAIREQRRRCRMIKREDLLPLILCVSQKRYLRCADGKKYNAAKAKEQFRVLADCILTACQMERLNEEKYELDALLCSCYRKEEMCSLADMLEEYFAKEE